MLRKPAHIFRRLNHHLARPSSAKQHCNQQPPFLTCLFGSSRTVTMPLVTGSTVWQEIAPTDFTWKAPETAKRIAPYLLLYQMSAEFLRCNG